MNRVISETFIKDLEEGVLRNILRYVKSDTTLAMEVRLNSINIYYRGGSLLKIKECNPNEYNAYFDKNYINSKESQGVILECISNIDKVEKTRKLIEVIPKIKQQMDFWMQMKKPNGGEREYHQIVAKENNYGEIGIGTDYFICDIEYSGSLKNGDNFKFDMIGVKWLSKGQIRDNKDNIDICLIEMKYGDNALRNTSRLVRQIEDMYKFLCDKENLNFLKKDMSEIFRIKSQLGLIYPYEKEEVMFSDKVEVIFIFGNQNPYSKTLLDELISIKDTQVYKKLSEIATIKIAIGSFVGYGLYENYMLPIDEAIEVLNKNDFPRKY